MARVAPRRWLSPDVLGLWGASLALRGAWMVPTLQALLSSVLVAPHGVPYPWWVVPALLAGGGVCRERLASRRRGRLLALGLGLVPAVAVVAATARAETASVAAWGGSLARGLVDCSDGLSASLIVLLGSALVWAWGVCTDRADYGAAGRDAVAGVLVLAMLLALVGPEGFASGLGPAAVVCLYLGVAAAALAVISAQRVQSLERLRPGGAPALSIAWLLVIAPLVGGSVIAGRLMAWLVSAGPVVAAVRLVGRAWQRAIGLLEPALYDLTYLAFRALEALVNGAMGLVGWLAEAMEIPGLRPPDVPLRLAHPPDLAPLLRGALVLLLVVGVACLVRRALRPRSRPPRRRTASILLSAWQRGSAVEEIRERVWPARGRRRPRLLNLVEADARRAAIRRLYRRFLQVAAEAGLPRPASATPLAFQKSVAELAKGAEPALQALTGAYTRARYTAAAITPGEVQEASKALAAVEAVLGPRREPHDGARAHAAQPPTASPTRPPRRGERAAPGERP